ncbi:MFS transporter [Lacticaseibacillus casei]|uniref:MFS transporter n=1 Tax=Lacticaseibacillus casei TaxID=1582 RepID=UPI001109E1B7|nr:MFS transporter [Lacticaseibacillus casei]TLQ49910.1 MFS transporter [Lacticaseibacillus casei]
MTRLTRVLCSIGLTIAMFMGTLDTTIVNIAIPKIMDDLHGSLANTSWVMTIYTLAMSVFMITTSKIADRYGRKKIMLLGLALFGGFSAACTTANSLPMLITFRFFQGLGGAIITPIVLPMGIEVFGKEKLNQVAALVGAVTALAAAGGPPIGGMILQVTSWRWIFGINVPLALLAFLLVAFCAHESYDESLAGRIDLPGLLLLTAALGGVTFGLLEGRQYGWQSTLILSSLIGGAVALVAFVVTEHHIKNPLLELDLFHEKTLSASSIVYFMTGFALVGPSLILNYFLQNVLGDSPLHAALIIIPVSLTIMVAMPIGTRLLAKIGAIPVTLAGMILMAASLFLLSLIKTNTATALIVVLLVINGFGFGFSSVSLVASVRYLPKNKSGIGSGIVNAARQIGTCLGIAILVTVLDTNIASAKTQIHHTADQLVTEKTLSPHVKTVAHQQLTKIFSGSSTPTTHQQKKMTRAITKAASAKTNLPKPVAGSDLRKLYDASVALQQGSSKLISGSATLTKAAQQSRSPLTISITRFGAGVATIAQGQRSALTGIKQIAQKQTLQTTFSEIKQRKNKHLAQAFSHTYLIGALIVLCLSPVAFWTDRRKVAPAKAS